MRTRAFVLVLAAACGDDSNAKRDAAVPRDTMDQPAADAPPLMACTPRNGTNITLRPVADLGSTTPMLVTAPKNDGRLFVVEREGRIRVVENEQLRTEAFLDMSDVPNFASGGEQGLLGLAFHPNYAINRQFFVFYTTDDENVVARYYVSETNYNKADPAGEVILRVPDFASNHNGGMIEFGPHDGYLYIGTGDGGGGGDPCKNSQEILRTASTCMNEPGSCAGDLNDPTNCEPLLGKILRIDVNTTTSGKAYGVPSTNPYADGLSGEPEIWMRGVRNPWRWSFDTNGDIYIGDVGQDRWEELTIIPANAQNGANLGWSVFEGIEGYPNGATRDPTGITMPQIVKSQPNVGPSDGWESIIAGQVYRGTCFPDLVGDFYFTDYSARELLRGRYSGNTFNATGVGTVSGAPSSIHADARGELYLTTLDGNIYQIEGGP